MKSQNKHDSLPGGWYQTELRASLAETIYFADLVLMNFVEMKNKHLLKEWKAASTRVGDNS